MRINPSLALAIAVALGTATTNASAADLWRDTASTPTPAGAASRGAMANDDMPARYRTVLLDTGRLDVLSRGAPTAPPERIELPLPDGGVSVFELERSNVLPPGLAARFPHLQSLKGTDAAGREVRIDITRQGIHALVRDESGDWMVRPESNTATTSRSGSRHLVFRRGDAPAPAWTEGTPEEGIGTPFTTRGEARRKGSDGTPLLRTFRLAMTATSAYTEKMGGTVEAGLAGIVRTVNRLNGIFESELGVHFVLAEGNDRLVFVRPEDDPFDRIAPGKGATDEQAVRLNVKVARDAIGDDAFDVGHVLDGRRNAGLAGTLGNTCMPWSGNEARLKQAKAAGMTGSAKPFGDAFHVDYVAHELGHQFGAHHTFAGCSGRTEDPASTYAPGSGSTIMGYAGICPRNNLQAHSDAYFHAASLEQIHAWLDDMGGACAVTRPNVAPAPAVDTTGWDKPLLVPARTPFRLTGTASFADPLANLTYTFEQMDLGWLQDPASDLVDTSRGPLFRSRPPQTTGTQTFPAMGVLLGHERVGLGDAFPESDRTLRFRMTVRDNLDQRSHVVSADRTVRIIDTGEAFAVEAPMQGALLRQGKSRLVRWNVADTVAPPIRCTKVDIDLSVDGGKTFIATPLAAAVPNKGRFTVTIPENTARTHDARLRVGCADGRFFALSDRIEIR